MIYQTDLKETLQNAFLDYAGSVAQERAIADVRDGLKIGLRRGLYAQYTNKLTHDNKFQKAQKSVAAAMAHKYTNSLHSDLPPVSSECTYQKLLWQFRIKKFRDLICFQIIAAFFTDN